MRLLRLGAGALLAACSAAAAAAAKGDGSATPYEDASLLEIVDLVTEESRFQDILAERQVLRGQPKACQNGVDGELLGRAIQRGFFSAVRNLIHACAESGVKLDRTLEETVNRLRREISDVANVLQHATREESVIAPAFEWAQSGNSVFLGVKFAHKLDAPACIDVVDQKVEILPSSIMLSATCKGKHKRFELKVDLLEPIDQEKSTWVMASVGRGTFTLVKSEPNLRWEKLLKGSEKPRNMHTWWQLHEKYENEIENLPSTSEPREPKKEKELSTASQTTGEKTQEEDNEPKPNEQSKTVEPSPEEEQEARLAKERAELKKVVKQLAKSISKETKKMIKESEGEFKSSLKVLDEKFKSERAELEAKNTKTKKKFESEKADLLSKVNAALEESLKLVGSDSIQNLKASLATAIEKVREESAESTGDVAGAWSGLMDKVSSLFGTGAEATAEKDEI